MVSDADSVGQESPGFKREWPAQVVASFIDSIRHGQLEHLDQYLTADVRGVRRRTVAIQSSITVLTAFGPG